VNALAAPTPCRAAALARIDAIDPAAYARTRNALDGAVSGLSPYLTHGIVSMPEVVARLCARHPRLGWDDKIVFELAWREWWQHVWRHRGAAILDDLRGPATWPGRYAAEVPADLREARTGVPAVDSAVRTLLTTGALHNHARMWLASYGVHLRKLHWRAGADWMFGHLLDGDLPSNHLSWQWVAGTFSSKPYLFNAENVARYAPRQGRDAWLSPGTAIDRRYEELDRLARDAPDVGAEPGTHDGVACPPLLAAPPGDAFVPADAALQRDARTLVTPWSLGDPQPGDGPRLGVVHQPAHAAFPWSERRWRWVLARMNAVCDGVFVGDVRTLPCRDAVATASPLPGVDEALGAVARLRPAPRWLPDPARPLPSFSAFYAAARRAAGAVDAIAVPG
jgi:deoxyribodipyrimidine photo-lyase